MVPGLLNSVWLFSFSSKLLCLSVIKIQIELTSFVPGTNFEKLKNSDIIPVNIYNVVAPEAITRNSILYRFTGT